MACCPGQESPEREVFSIDPDAVCFVDHKSSPALIDVNGAPSDMVVSSIRAFADEVRECQEGREQQLRDFIRKELQLLKVSLVAKIDASGEQNQRHVEEHQEHAEGSGNDSTNKAHDQLNPVVPISEVDTKRQGLSTNDTGGMAEKPQAQAQFTSIVPTSDVDKPQSLAANTSGGVAEKQQALESPAQHPQSLDMEDTVDDVDDHNMYKEIMSRRMTQTSFWQDLALGVGFKNCVIEEAPRSRMVSVIEHPAFAILQTTLILSNTCLMGFEADQSIKAAIQQPRGKVPEWIVTCNIVYNLFFAAEVLFRIVALRMWFWVAPYEWGWNLFDASVVVSSLLTDVLGGANLSFLRAFRMLRAIRVARVIRVLRFFRQLRKMLLSILACVGSLIWCFVFLSMTIFMFSVLCLQGAAQALHDLEEGSQEYREALVGTERWYGSMLQTMFSLLVAVTGGTDWMTIRAPLNHAGALYTGAFLLYILFVTVGVMNVLTGVFLSSADEFVDHSLVCQNEQIRIDAFVKHMMELFSEFDLEHTGEFDWETFAKAMKEPRVQTYFSAHHLEPTHARLLFSLLDDNNSGKVNVIEFVLGMLRLKGEAKAIDARILQREMSALPSVLKTAMMAERGPPKSKIIDI